MPAGPSLSPALHAPPSLTRSYKNKSIKSVIANLEAGKRYPATGDETDTQANMLCKVGAAAGVVKPIAVCRRSVYN